jgi:basic membrane protein A
MKRNITRRDALRTAGAASIIGLAGCGGDDGNGNGGNGGNGNGNGGNGNGGNGNGNGGNGNGNGGNGNGNQMDEVRAAWVYVSEVGDLGWSWAHDQGRQAVEDEFDWLETDYTESVAPPDSERVIRQYACLL